MTVGAPIDGDGRTDRSFEPVLLARRRTSSIAMRDG